jgi:hypothetical protein
MDKKIISVSRVGGLFLAVLVWDLHRVVGEVIEGGQGGQDQLLALLQQHEHT